MCWFYLVCYILFSFGISVMVTNEIGPFNLFFRLRLWAKSIGDNFGLLFTCMFCFPTNVGIAFSLFNWFLLPVAISPFNIILSGTNLWWLAAIMDGCLTGGVCQFLWNIDDLIDKSTPMEEDVLEYEEDE